MQYVLPNTILKKCPSEHDAICPSEHDAMCPSEHEVGIKLELKKKLQFSHNGPPLQLAPKPTHNRSK